MHLAHLRRAVAERELEQRLLLLSQLVLSVGWRKDVARDALRVPLVDQRNLVKEGQGLHAAPEGGLPHLVARALQVVVEGQAAEKGLARPLEEGEVERHVVGDVRNLIDGLVQRHAQCLGHYRAEHDQQDDRRGGKKEKEKT